MDWSWLNGKKTYIVGIASALVAAAAMPGVEIITPEQHSAIALVLGAIAGTTVAHKVYRDKGLGAPK